VANVSRAAARVHAQRRQQLCAQVRALIVDRLELPVPVDWITDDQPLFGRGLELDSLDALELSLGIDAEYGIPSYEDAAPMFGSVAAFVEHRLSREAAGLGAELIPSPAGRAGQAGVMPEYAALRDSAARFDLGGSGVLEVTGPGAFDLVQAALARDVQFVTPEQSLVSLLLGPHGDVVDLVTVYLIGDGFWLETSPGRGTAVLSHLSALLAASRGAEAVLTDRREDLDCLLVEGPAAPGLVASGIAAELSAIPYGSVLPVTVDGRPVIAARSGHTGEFGYKFFGPPDDLRAVRSALAPVTGAGLGTLRTAMLEVRQPVLDWEAVSGVTALQAGYQWLIDITKDDFCGKPAVVAEFEAGLRSRVIGIAVPGAATPRAGAELTVDGDRAGHVVTALRSPGRGDVLGLALIDLDVAAAGVELQAGELTVTTLAAPYVYPASWAFGGSGIAYG
jgi:aminomethyltransferase